VILSDTDILRELEKEDGLTIEPLADIDQQVQPASCDVRLHENIITFDRTNLPCIHPQRDDEVEKYVTERTIDSDEFILHPGDFILASTIERVEIPPDLVGTLEGRSSLGRLAVAVHSTAGFLDPGFQGQITLELSNLGTSPVALQPGMRIGQIVLTELRTPATRPYGEERGSKYQNQSGPETSRIGEDQEVN
jgi:dCTP deaminase